MSLDPFLKWLESTALSQWVIGSPSILAFPGILCVHAIGMGLAVGISAALDLRILGVAPGIPVAEIRRFLPMLWFGFWINAISGVLLLVGYPTKALTNPVFYVKLTLIGAAMALLVHISRRLFGGDAPPDPLDDPLWSRQLRWLAVVSLACWVSAITSGRLLAYTYKRLTQDF